MKIETITGREIEANPDSEIKIKRNTRGDYEVVIKNTIPNTEIFSKPTLFKVLDNCPEIKISGSSTLTCMKTLQLSKISVSKSPEQNARTF